MARIRIIVHKKDGKREVFEPEAVGSTRGNLNTVRYEGGFAIVTDIGRSETAFPEGDISKVEKINI